MRELLEHPQDAIEALKREIRNPKSDEYRKARKGTGERLQRYGAGGMPWRRRTLPTV